MVRSELLTTHPNLMCIWYHDRNISIEVQHHVKIYLQRFPYSRIFKKTNELIDYLKKPLIKHIVFIITTIDKDATVIEKLVKRRNHFRNSYRLQLGDHTTSVLPNIASIHSMIKTSFATIFEDLQKSAHSVTQNEDTAEQTNAIDMPAPAFDTFRLISAERSFCSLTNESLKFLLFQSLMEVLIKMTYDKSAFVHMWSLCCTDCSVHPGDAEKIKKAAQKYKKTDAINYYTQNLCLFRLINRAFRQENIEKIFRFGCFLADLHHQLEMLENRQRVNGSHDIKTFYRGKRFSSAVVQQFRDNVGHLISINGLLSTTIDYDIASIFAGMEADQDDYQRVMFEINIDCTAIRLVRPHANIKEYSANSDENEVLFFMGYVWRIESMEPTKANHWHIVLKSCADYDNELIKYIEDSRSDCTYLTIGNILRELGDYANANNFYERMLDTENLTDQIRGHVYYNMGITAYEQGAYLQALRHFREAEKFIDRKSTCDNELLAPSRPLFSPHIAGSYVHVLNNKGRCYLRDGRYQSAEENFQAALRESSSKIERATVLNNYALLEYRRGNVNQARDYLKEAVTLAINNSCVSEFKRNLDAIVKQCEYQNIAGQTVTCF